MLAMVNYETWQHPADPDTLEIRASNAGGLILGALRLHLNKEPGILLIVAIQVLPAHRGLGLAKALHARGLLEAEARGLRLRGIDARNPAYAGVWAKMQAAREVAEKEA